jgi:hypothetical protein
MYELAPNRQKSLTFREEIQKAKNARGRWIKFRNTPKKNQYQKLQQDDVFAYAKCVNYEFEEH